MLAENISLLGQKLSRVITRASYWFVPVIHASHPPEGQCGRGQAVFLIVIGLHYRGGAVSLGGQKLSRSKPALCLCEVLPQPSVFLVENKALKNSMDKSQGLVLLAYPRRSAKAGRSTADCYYQEEISKIHEI